MNLKKRIMILLTAVCMIITTVVGSPIMVSAESISAVPEIGDEIFGFSITDTSFDKATKSTKIQFEHIQTGAKLLVIKNKDVNRGFSIKFNTPPDSKGVNHILEHSVLGGSEKYPSKNSIFDIVNTTYVSFANALTYPNMTLYPICSQSEKQLLKSADIYLDAVFNPLILSDQRIFEREGWRYELTDEASDLAYNGIVYNEMQGIMGNISSVSIANANKTIFPDTDQGNYSGGYPSDILSLTYEELLDTYNKYYHPSNCFIVLYGDLDYENFLEMIDRDYLSSYDKKTIYIDRKVQDPFEKLVEKTYVFPVAEGTDTNNKAVIDLVFAVDDIKELGLENFMSLNLALSLLDLESSDLKKALMNSQIADSYSMQLDLSTYQPTIHFIASNADPSKSKEFYKLIMDELGKIVKNGLNTNLVKSSLRSMEFQEEIGSGNAVNDLVLASLFDNLLDNPQEDYLSYIRIIADKLDENVLEETIKNQILENKLVALTVTKPEAGLLEKNQMEIAEGLSDVKSKMTKKEIKALVKKTADFNIWNSQSTSDEVLKSLRAVNLKDISVDFKERKIDETTVDGVDLWSVVADVDELSAVQMYFDMSHLSKEELMYLNFYNDMLNNGMNTKNRSEMEVMDDVTYLLDGLSTSIEIVADDKEDKLAHPVFSLAYYGFKNEYDQSFELVYDILMQSDLEDISTYGKRTIANIKANYDMQFAEPFSIMQYRGLAYSSAKYRLMNYLYGLDYYNFVLSLEKDIENDPVKAYHKLFIVRAKAFRHNKDRLSVLFAGDSDAIDKFKASMPSFTSKFSEGRFAAETYTLPAPAKREAILINSPVQYVCANASLSNNEVPYSTKGQVISTILNNLLLTPEIRLKGGAYGVGATILDDNYLVYTYRDSNFVNSLNIISATDEFLLSIEPYMTKETLDSYILSLLGSVNQSSGEINDALNVIREKYYGVTRQDKIDRIEEMKNTSVSDILIYADYLSKMNEDLNYVVVASPATIEQYKDLFDSIISLR